MEATNFTAIALGFLIFIIASLIHLILSSKHASKLPPGPPTLPLLGNLHLLGKYPHQSLHKLAQIHGPLMSIWLGNRLTIIASSANSAAHFLKTHDQTFANRPSTEVSLALSYNGKNIGLAPYGPYWRFLRKVCNMRVFNSKTYASFEYVRAEELSLMMRSLWEKAVQGEEVTLRTQLLTLSNNAICRMALGKRLIGCPETENIRQLIREAFRLVGAFNVGDYVPWLTWLDLQGYRRAAEKTNKELDRGIQVMIDEHKQRRRKCPYSLPNDIVDVLLSVQEEEDAEIKLTDDSIKAVVLDVFSAGTETTATATEWAMAELVRRPDLLKEAQEEVDKVIGKERGVEEKDLKNLTFVEAVVKETLRLHPPTPLLFPHMSSEDVAIGPFHLPAGTRLLVNAWAIGRDPNVWTQPSWFHPRRFLDSESTSVIDILGGNTSDFTLIPFGAGRRGCPGNAMGLNMVHLALATLVHGFDWPMASSLPHDFLKCEGFGLTVPMANPLRLHPVARLPLHHPYYNYPST